MAALVCFPLSPRTKDKVSEAGFITLGWSKKLSVEFTNPVILIQFFIWFKSAPNLDRQYTVFGKVIEGMEFVDKIKRGDDNNNGSVSDPDKIISFKSK